MNCWTRDEMDRCLASSTSVKRKELELHRAVCACCQKLFEDVLQEQMFYSESLFRDELPEDFTQRVMASLKDAEIEPVKAESAVVRTSRARYSRIAAGVLVLTIMAALALNGPTVAEMVRSLFSRDNVDIGLLRAQELGIVHNPEIKVKDQGYTLKIEEAVADPTRVVMALQLFGPDGRHDDDRLTMAPGNQIQIKDEQGRMLGQMYDMGLTGDFYYMVAFFPEPIQADKIYVEGTIRQLGNEIQRLPVVEGQWNFRFAMDLREAKAQTVVIPLQGELTAKEGMTVRLKQLTRMVQGVRFELETELSSEAIVRSPGDLWKDQELSFHFEDESGEEIHSVNSRMMPHKDSLMSYQKLPGEKPGVMRHSYTFKYLPEESPYRFVWDGFTVAQTDGTAVELVTNQLAQQPVTFRAEGDELTIRRFTLEPSPDPRIDKEEAALHVEGTFMNERLTEGWSLKTADGRKFRVDGRGAISGENGRFVLSGASADPSVLFQFRMQELTELPDRVTLVREVVNKFYPIVERSVDVIEKR